MKTCNVWHLGFIKLLVQALQAGTIDWIFFCMDTLTKFNNSPLKNDGWKMILSFLDGQFSGGYVKHDHSFFCPQSMSCLSQKLRICSQAMIVGRVDALLEEKTSPGAQNRWGWCRCGSRLLFSSLHNLHFQLLLYCNFNFAPGVSSNSSPKMMGKSMNL